MQTTSRQRMENVSQIPAECTTHVGCAWCVSSNKCDNDAALSCKGGPEDHVGQLKGALGKCDGTTAPATMHDTKLNMDPFPYICIFFFSSCVILF